MTQKPRSRLKAELEAEIDFYREMCKLLMESNEIGFVTMQEAVEMTGVSEKSIYAHTRGFVRGYQIVPIPWIRWYKYRMANGFAKWTKKDIAYKKKRSGSTGSSNDTT